MVRKRVGVWVVFLKSIFFNVVVRWSGSSSLVWKLSSFLLFALSSDSRVQTQRPSEVLTVDTSINTSWGLTHKTWGLKSNQTNKSVGAQAAQWGSHSQTDLKQVQLVKITVCSPRGPTPVRLVQHGRKHHWRASSHYFRNIWSQKRQHSQRGRLNRPLRASVCQQHLRSGLWWVRRWSVIWSISCFICGRSTSVQPRLRSVASSAALTASSRPLTSCFLSASLWSLQQLSAVRLCLEVDLLLNTNLDWNILCYIH